MRFVTTLILLIGWAAAAVSAADYDRPNGIKIPADLAVQARKQNTLAAPVIKAVEAAKGKPLGPTPDLPAWDWATKQQPLIVHNQGSCGSCWDFAGCAAYRIAKGAQTGDWKADPSEQDVLNCSGVGSCNGGWVPFGLFCKRGVLAAKSMPYLGRQTRCQAKEGPYKALTWAYVSGEGDIPDDAEMIDAVCRYGALWVCIRADGRLSNYSGGEWVSPGGPINHAVVIVGWTPTAWVVMNSWGSGWGPDGGKFLCRRGSNIGLGASYVIVQPVWMASDEAAGLAAAATDCPSCDAAQIDGPTTAACGTLVTLTAPDVPDSQVSWELPDNLAKANTRVDSGRRILDIATGCTPCETLIVCAVSRPDSPPQILLHRLIVGEGEPTPAPPPGPTPDPQPAPTPPVEIDAFGKQVAGWASALIPAPERQARGEKVAANFEIVANRVKSGELTTLADAMGAAYAANSEDLAGQASAWSPFFDELSKRWGQALQANELGDAESVELAARQCALGLRAALPKSATSTPCPGAVCPTPTKPAAQRSWTIRKR